MVKELKYYLSPKAYNYHLQITCEQEFVFRIKKNRKSKLGDFSVGRFKKPTITINENLPEDLFLFTYLHELAHFFVFKKYRNRVQPHGKEWKEIYSDLLLGALRNDLFEEPFLEYVLKFLAKPRATIDLSQINHFKPIDTLLVGELLLNQVENKASFEFRGKRFQKIIKRRTRVLCLNLDNQRQYTVSGEARVTLID